MQAQEMRKFSIKNLAILKTKFNLKPYRAFLAYGGSIYRDSTHEGYFTDLYHVMPSAKGMMPVRNIQYFANKISISSSEEAMSFVRLLTSPLMEDAMDDFLGYEVLIKEDFNSDDWLGFDMETSTHDSGFYAVVSKKDADGMKVHPAVCTKGSSYKISRYILQYDKNGLIHPEYGPRRNLFMFHKEVTSAGRYRVVKKILHKYNVNSVKWSFTYNL